MEKDNKENKKDKDIHKLEKKLQKAGTTLQELLQEEPICEMFRANNPHLHSLYHSTNPASR